MTNKEDKMGKLFDLFTGKSIEQTSPGSISQKVEGDNNIVAGGNVTVHKNENIINRNPFTPGPEHITSAQANKIQQLIYKISDMEVASGFANGDVGKARAKWWVILRNHYNVNTYLRIPRYLGEDAIAWLKQQKGMNRHKTRKTDNPLWRNEHYSAIYAKTGELGISKGELYALVNQRLDKKITSLKQLSDQNLKKLYNMVMSL